MYNNISLEFILTCQQLYLFIQYVLGVSRNLSSREVFRARPWPLKFQAGPSVVGVMNLRSNVNSQAQVGVFNATQCFYVLAFTLQANVDSQAHVRVFNAPQCFFMFRLLLYRLT